MSECQDSFNCIDTLNVSGKEYKIVNLQKAERNGLKNISKLPFSLKVLLENLLRNEDGRSVTKDDIQAFSSWVSERNSSQEVAFRPARVLMQDFTGVPAVVDLASMREAMDKLGGDPQKINPLSPVHLVIDHSVMVDEYGTKDSFEKNVAKEFERNGERYELLKWAQSSFANFNVIPPGTGVCHQVNLEHIASVVFSSNEWLYPDSVVGTDSHTTMINGLAVLGWGVGGIEAEAAILAQPITMLIPEVIGVELTGKMPTGTVATDLVLKITQVLRQYGVVGKFVEYFGKGLDSLSLADRATIANMAPEYGATCGIFPIDEETIKYMRLTGRDEHTCERAIEYAKKQGMWRDSENSPVFTDVVKVDLNTIVPAIAGPKRPHDRIDLVNSKNEFSQFLNASKVTDTNKKIAVTTTKGSFDLEHGAVVIAAITSCTNTSNPTVLIAAGLIAKKAVELGLKSKPWVKTSLAPGSQVVTNYLDKAGLTPYLDELGFNLVGYGCTTCIGNSGPLAEEIITAVDDGDLVVCGVLSGNRNFEGRVSPHTRANYLASPPLVVAYALAGNMNVDLDKDVIGKDKNNKDIYLKDLWPSSTEIQSVLSSSLNSAMFTERYGNVSKGPKQWQDVQVKSSFTFPWSQDSTYARNPPFFDNMINKTKTDADVVNANILGLFGDNITTDHISPAGAIKADSPAGEYLKQNNINRKDFNSYGSRRGNHEVMMRGTFANIRIKNLMVGGKEGGYTKYIPNGKEMSIYDAAMMYQKDNKPLVVFGGKEYGMGSSRDWAAKGTLLLGVKAVIAESFERIHRSNLIGMGVLPFEFKAGETVASLGLDGSEEVTITDVENLKPKGELEIKLNRKDGSSFVSTVKSRIDTEDEMEYYRSGGILQYVMQGFLDK